MRIVFAGTPDFAAIVLQFLLDRSWRIDAVLTQPDRPAGRGRRLLASPVKQLADHHNLAVLQPRSLRNERARDALRELEPDLIIVVAYGLILPRAVLELPRHGCINVHASLLPRWRGAAPIQRAILAGDRETGITIMQMDEGLDTGAMLERRSCPIHADDTAATLHDRLAALGAEALIATLERISAGTLQPVAQDERDATYAAKIDKSESRLDWRSPAIELERRVRAFNPWPGAFTTLGDQRVKVWKAEVVAGTVAGAAPLSPGTVAAVGTDGIDIAAGAGMLRLLEIQRAGGRRLAVRDFLNAHPVAAGDVAGG